jgi:hypothetical protein
MKMTVNYEILVIIYKHRAKLAQKGEELYEEILGDEDGEDEIVRKKEVGMNREITLNRQPRGFNHGMI